ncbi:MAG: hypothetical protein Tsb002_32570 [Wenzhouxiangellaceae bacterium]
MDKEQYITDRLEVQINWYNKKSIKNQRWFRWLQVITIILSISIPFLSGYERNTPELQFVIGVLGLIVAVFTGILGVFQFQKHWLEYRATCEALKREKYLFLTGAEPYNSEDAFALLVDTTEGIMLQENTNWKNYMIKAKKNVTPG